MPFSYIKIFCWTVCLCYFLFFYFLGEISFYTVASIALTPLVARLVQQGLKARHIALMAALEDMDAWLDEGVHGLLPSQSSTKDIHAAMIADADKENSVEGFQRSCSISIAAAVSECSGAIGAWSNLLGASAM